MTTTRTSSWTGERRKTTKTTKTPRTGTRPRPLPQRTCVGCGTVQSKREMVRVIRTPEGRVEADPTGKKSGRGAYLCPKPECWETGLRKGRLAHSLKTTIPPADAEALLGHARGLGLVEVAG